MTTFILTNSDDVFPGGGDDNSGSDSISGLGGNDTITAGTGLDTVLGGDGDDRLIGGNGNDNLFGNAGADTLLGGNEDDTLDGGAGADRLDGGAGFDHVSYKKASLAVGLNFVSGIHTGDAAGDIFVDIEQFDLSDNNDTFVALNAALVFGGKGNDTLTGGAGIDSLHGGDGNDSLNAASGNDFTYGDAGNDTLIGGLGADSLDGGSGDDRLLGSAGADTLNGGGGFDTATYRGAGALTINIRTGVNTGDAAGDIYDNIEAFLLTDNGDQFYGKIVANVSGFAGADTIWAGGLDDTISGGDDDDEIRGGNGNDFIDGDAGKDKMSGDAGDDTVRGGNDNDQLEGGAGADLLNGGSGNDDVVFKKSKLAPVTINLLTNVHTGDAAGDTYVSIEGFGLTQFDDTFTAATTAVTVSGNGGNDTVFGGDGADSLLGGDGKDSLAGGAGKDTIEGGAGRDLMFGGSENDKLIAGAAEITLVSRESLGAQGDGNSTHVDISSDGEWVSFTSQSTNFSLSDPDGGIPEVFRHSLTTGVTDWMGTGTYSSVSDGGTYVAFMSYPTPSNISYLMDANGHFSVTSLVNSAAPHISTDGNFIATSSTAGTTASVLDRAAVTTDTVSAGGSLQWIGDLSSEGRYVVFQAAFPDGQHHVYRKDTVTDVVTQVDTNSIGTSGNGFGHNGDVSNFATNQGRYVAFSSDSTNLVAGDSNLSSDVFLKDIQTFATTRLSVGTDGTEGNADSGVIGDVKISDDGRFVIFTSDASNLVAGDTNHASDIFLRDTLSGGTYLVSTGASDLGANRGSYRPSINADGTAIAFQSDASNLIAGDFNGRSDIFVMTGDRMSGGTGNDDFEVHSILDQVIENVGEGSDQVKTDLSNYALTPNVEVLTYIGLGNFTGRGNDLGNVLNGGAGADTLIGALGADTLVGGAGADTFVYTLAGDAVTVSGVRDTLSDFVSGTDSIRIDYGVIATSFTLANGATDGVLGQVRYNAPTGRLSIEGGVGSDPDIQINSVSSISVGGDISVTLQVDGASNVTTLGGADRITAINAFANVISTGQGADMVDGGAGDDQIDTGGGDDTITGGFGADVLTGGGGADVFRYYLPNASVGRNDQQGFGGVQDTITDFQSGVDHIQIDFGSQGSPQFLMADGQRPGNVFSFGQMHYDGTEGELRVLGYGDTADLDLIINSTNAIDINNDVDIVLSAYRPDYAVQIQTLGGNDWVSILDGPIMPIKNPGFDISISTGAGNDTVVGTSSNDIITGGLDADTLSGGDSDDIFVYSLVGDSQGAGQARDLITDFRSGEDRISIDFGNQSIGFTISDGQNDGVVGKVHYDANSQTLTAQGAGAGTAQDLVIRTVGPVLLSDIDVVAVLSAVADFDGFVGNDKISTDDVTAFANEMRGNSGNDTLDGGLGDDRLFGGQGNDKLMGGADNDVINGGLGADLIDGGDGGDRIAGGDGDDDIKGGAGRDTLIDDQGLDRMSGGDGDDLAITNGLQTGEKLDMGFGDDTVRFIGHAGDTLRLTNVNFVDGAGSDFSGDSALAAGQADGGALTIVLSTAAGEAQDVNVNLAALGGYSGVFHGVTVLGNDGANIITGTGYGDTIRGGDGADVLFGLGGADILDGGRGADTYVFKGFPGSKATNHAGSFEGTTIRGAAMAGLDKFLVEATDDGHLEIVSGVTIDGAGVTWGNLATSIGNALGTDFFDDQSPLQGHQGLVLTIQHGEAAGTYLILDNLATDMHGYQAQFDAVIRLEDMGGKIDTSDFGYLRTASGDAHFVGVDGARDVLNYTMLSDANLLLSGADTVAAMDFGGEDKFQFLSSQFGGLTRVNGHNFIVADAGGDLTRASLADATAMADIGHAPVTSKLSVAIGKLVEAQVGHAVDGPFFALVYDNDARHHGANAATYLVYDANGTNAHGTVGEQNSGFDPDISIIARFDGVPSAQDLDAGDFWFDVDAGGVALEDLTGADPFAV